MFDCNDSRKKFILDNFSTTLTRYLTFHSVMCYMDLHGPCQKLMSPKKKPNFGYMAISQAYTRQGSTLVQVLPAPNAYSNENAQASTHLPHRAFLSPFPSTKNGLWCLPNDVILWDIETAVYHWGSAQRSSHKPAQTHAQMGPILLPRPLMREVKNP